jgi:hypothetical protein
VVQALGLSAELDELFVLKRQSIAQMEQAQAVEQRQRAPRRKSPSSRSPSSKAAGVKIGHYVSQP